MFEQCRDRMYLEASCRVTLVKTTRGSNYQLPAIRSRSLVRPTDPFPSLPFERSSVASKGGRAQSGQNRTAAIGRSEI